MSRILVIYYSMFGHIEALANAVANGARSVAGAEVSVLPHRRDWWTWW